MELRSSFLAASRMLTHWYPGHMAKGLKEMQERIKDIDCILEVHDARIPLSGRNEQFTRLCVRPRLLLLNKADLIPPTLKPAIISRVKASGVEHVVFAETKQDSPQAMHQVVREVINTMKTSTGVRRKPDGGIRLMVVGVPNVGKSSLINAMRRVYAKKGKCAITGSQAGVTRTVNTEVRINTDPNVYLIDTPGIMLPSLSDPNVAMKLALTGALRDEHVGLQVIADYLLFVLNRQNNLQYVDLFKMSGPSDDINVVLPAVARKIGALQTGGVVDIERAAAFMVHKFRAGYFGKILLDNISPLHPLSLPTPYNNSLSLCRCECAC
eukprot:m.388886 g.388886  ORF g.388886 m.388886 type:complete len:325 (-) comp56327_c0_seq4:49-1023(-)